MRDTPRRCFCIGGSESYPTISGLFYLLIYLSIYFLFMNMEFVQKYTQKRKTEHIYIGAHINALTDYVY